MFYVLPWTIYPDGKLQYNVTNLVPCRVTIDQNNKWDTTGLDYEQEKMYEKEEIAFRS